MLTEVEIKTVSESTLNQTLRKADLPQQRLRGDWAVQPLIGMSSDSWYELDQAHVILDDAAARSEAKELDLTILGTIGLVLRAKRQGHISAVRPLLHALQGSGFWMSEALYRHVLRRAGEE